MEKVLSSIIISLVEEGVFGDVEFKEINYKNDTDIGAQFGSAVVFATLVVKNNSGELLLPIVTKLPMTTRTKKFLLQFMMESLMYKEVLPTLDFNQGYYPKLYYSNVNLEKSSETVLIFENVKYKHYNHSKSKLFLDFDHISLALKTMAKFHSLSFILKHENMAKFNELTEKIKDYETNAEVNSVFNLPIYAAIERGIRAFEKVNGPDEVLGEFLEAVKDYALLREQLSMPEEPFDVISHGDFCNNNIMHKYNEGGSLVDCIVFDFQLSLHGNVVIDLAFLLYMNTNSDCREKYWDSFLKIYWETLKECVPGHIELPKYEDFLEYFGARAVYGYIISSFFLPMVMNPDVPFWGNLPMDKQIALMKTLGGHKAEKAIVDIFSHMYEKKYIHYFLKCIKTK